MTRMLKESLKGILTSDELALLSSGFDMVGDIAILRIDARLASKKQVIASTLLQRNRTIKTVLGQSSPVSGEYRVRDLEHLAGEKKTVTTHREHGCVFEVDLSKVYFSPRLSTERLRIAQLVSAGEVVVNMFAGVGAFSIVIAKKTPVAKVFSIDVNPSAYELQVKNVGLNRVEGRVVPMLGDSGRIILSSLKGVADRVLMPLPEGAQRFLPDALIALKESGGAIHYYRHVHAAKGEDPIAKAVQEVDSSLGSAFAVLGKRIVREIGPRWFEVVLDINPKKDRVEPQVA